MHGVKWPSTRYAILPRLRDLRDFRRHAFANIVQRSVCLRLHFLNFIYSGAKIKIILIIYLFENVMIIANNRKRF